MADARTLAIAKRAIRASPWCFAGTVAFGAVTCFYGVAPAPYLFVSIGLGFIGFAMFVLALRIRSDMLRVGMLWFICFSQPIFWQLTGGGQYFEIFQGFSVSCAVLPALVLLLRHWLFKFAKLEDHVG